MPSTTLKRRRTEEGMRGRVPKKEKKHVKRQKFYHSSSEDEGGATDAPRDFAPVSLEESDHDNETVTEKRARKKKEEEQKAEEQKAEEQKAAKPATKFTKSILVKRPAPAAAENAASSSDDSESEPEADEFNVADSETDESDDSEGSISETSTNNARKVRKRNDPEAFATSISKILNTKLTSQKRSEPILSRSKDAQEANKALSDHRLTEKARRQLIAEKKAAKENGRIKDVLGLNDPGFSTANTTAKEKELRRTAQKGVIKLFNAVRAAQVKGELAEKEAKEQGMVGMAKREEKVQEMSKQGFLDMIAGGQKHKEGSVEA